MFFNQFKCHAEMYEKFQVYDVNIDVKVQKYICFSPDAHGVYKSR